MTQKMDKTIELILNNLVEVRRIAYDAWRKEKRLSDQRPLSHETLKTYNKVFEKIYPKHYKELKKIINEIKETQPSNFNILDPICLPPLENQAGFVPLLQLSFTESDGKIDLSFNVEMYYTDSTIKNEPLRFIGFRYEMHQITSKHFYPHIQLFHTSKISKKPLVNYSHDWIPDTIPCLPLLAANPSELFLVMLFSLYGNKIYAEYFSDYKKGIDKKYYQLTSRILTER